MKLFSGIQQFQDSVFPKMNDRFDELKNGQSPETLFITCSDSRIDPSLMTQTDPGELFVIRNAGNIVPKPGEGELAMEATIQYAVDVLKVANIVVCGHSHCGAVGGLLNLDSLESLPVIRDWVKKSERVLEQIDNPKEDGVKAIQANALLQLDHLREYECVTKAIEEGRLSLHAWVYHFETGAVDFLSEDSMSGTNV